MWYQYNLELNVVSIIISQNNRQRYNYSHEDMTKNGRFLNYFFLNCFSSDVQMLQYKNVFDICYSKLHCSNYVSIHELYVSLPCAEWRIWNWINRRFCFLIVVPRALLDLGFIKNYVVKSWVSNLALRLLYITYSKF